MEPGVILHDKVGRPRLTEAVEPLPVDTALELFAAAAGETVRGSLGTRAAEVEVTVCGDAEMTRLNFDHMGERGPTDVLSFPLHEWSVESGHSHLADEDSRLPESAPLVLGDVVIDLDQAMRQAAEGDWSVAEEIALLAIHGTLHLLGHDHDDADGEAAMREAEHRTLTVLHRRFHGVEWKPGSLFDRAGHAVVASY
ncbi:MAG TPA: rRNA maturation RNase YbeY [Candidatus Limnocylindria bacterium]|nr:rRNA maturation RNase YbeY [Candidatus Limnocylindria bacterium]